MKSACRVYDILKMGPMDYMRVWRWQKALMEDIHSRKKAGQMFSESLLLVEHSDVYTLGRGADSRFLLSEEAKRLAVRVERGGEVTYHGPGQIVLYPILDLNQHRRDLHWYVRSLEEVVIRTLKTYSIHGGRSEVNSGVWVGADKVSAVGMTSSRWLTMHGLALNVSCDLSKYSDHIVPCGIEKEGRGVTSISRLLESKALIPSLEDVGDRLLKEFSGVFELPLAFADNAELDTCLDRFPDIKSRQTVNILS